MRVDAFDAPASRSGDRRRGRGCDARDGFYAKPTLVVPKSLQSSMCRNESFGPATRVARPAAVRVRTAY
ncbi:hypothetical protein WL99_28195 [Burkholderia cepacia]|nr:hypothetical protein WL99_28195 [Burkholderia cepacia]MDW9230514.1 hypothetical protein [Burkholderia cepacia]